MRTLLLLLAALAAGAAAPPPTAASAPAGDAGSLERAAALYHGGRYDSARTSLEALLAGGTWRRRDSLVLLHYLGMAHSRLGADSPAVARFRDLLALDSLFRVPRNEDPAVVANFEAARRARFPRPAPAGPATAAQGNLPATPPAPAAPPSLPAGLSGTAPSAGGTARGADGRRPMSLALGAVPLGGGWLARGRTVPGTAHGVLQAGGLLLALYASGVQSRGQDDRYGLEAAELGRMERWQWTQRISLTTAAGAYLYSIIAAGRE